MRTSRPSKRSDCLRMPRNIRLTSLRFLPSRLRRIPIGEPRRRHQARCTMLHMMMNRGTLVLFCIGLTIALAAGQEDEHVATEIPVHVASITRTILRAYVAAYGMVEPEP